MSTKDKTVLKGSSNQSGAEVHRKTHGHIKTVADAMFGKSSHKLPAHQSVRADAPRSSSSGKSGQRQKTGVA